MVYKRKMAKKSWSKAQVNEDKALSTDQTLRGIILNPKMKGILHTFMIHCVL